MIFTSYCNLGYDTHVFPHRCFLYFNLHSGNQDKNKTEEINVVTSTQAHVELAILFALFTHDTRRNSRKFTPRNFIGFILLFYSTMNIGIWLCLSFIYGWLYT